VLTETQLRAIHLAPFRAAIERGVGTVMASYSSWNGVKMPDYRFLLTDVLKGELGFRGFVVSDWEAIDQIDRQPGFTAEEVRRSINPGFDMVMVPNVDFGSRSPTAVLTRLASGSGAVGTIELRLDSPTGPRIAAVPVQDTGGWQSWRSRTVALERRVTGIHRLYVTFIGPAGQDLVNLNWFQFGDDPITPTSAGEEPDA
jgi:hypothetical protein